jgi:PAS domain S-box-containing protein
VQEISLAPLGRDDLWQLIVDALRCEPERAAPLAQLVHERTEGNPFFAIQFLSGLVEEGLLTFDHDAGRWCWDLGRTHAKAYTDNVVDLMVGKLSRLAPETQTALQQLACLGNVAEVGMLSTVLETSEERVHADLWAAVRLEMVERLDGSYRLAHDRVQEAAYLLIPAERRAATHLRIGRLLHAQTPPEKREEAIFDIVNHLNRGAALITSQDEHERLAELDLIAGQRAKATSAYASALTYLIAGAAQLGEDCWERRHELIFQLELHRAECEFLTGALAEAEQRLSALSARAATTVERATVACLRVDLYTTLDQSARAIAVGLDYLRQLGVDWSPHPTQAEARREYDEIWTRLGKRAIEGLVDLPILRDPASLATLDVLTRLLPPALFTDVNLLALMVSRAVNLSLERGHCDGSCVAYVRLGMIAGPRFGDYEAGLRFGLLGYELVERCGLRRFQAATYMLFGAHIAPWTGHLRSARDALRCAFDIARKTGDLSFAAYTCGNLNSNLLAAGDPLADVQREAENGLEFCQKMRFGFVVDLITSQLAVARALRGLTRQFGVFDEDADELRMERRFAGNRNLAVPECWYWIRKLQVRFLVGDYVAAVEAASRAQRLLWILALHLEAADYHFYGALAHAAICDDAAAGRRQQHLDAVSSHHRQLDIWAKHCPESFEDRAALVGAEIARLGGRDMDAMRLYDQAIRSARANGFVHNEAIAYERAAAFYRARGVHEVADLYLRNARYGYLRWGADGKVRQLDEMYPHLKEEERTPASTSTIVTPVETLDLATVIKLAQAVAGEIVLEKLVDTLMRTAIEHAGAERGVLLLTQGPEPRIVAEAATKSDAVIVRAQDASVSSAALPVTIIHYVVRTRESVVLDDASIHAPFAADAYVRQRRVRSVLCLPLVNQAKLIGLIYLENNLAPRVFAPARTAVLKLLSSQAAIALEIARLYGDLEQREAKIRRLVDANIIGIFFWELEGRIIEANDTFLRMVGCDRQDLAAGRVRWTDLTPPDWRDRAARAAAEVTTIGSLQPYEKEFFRKDGSRVPVLIGSAAFDEQRDQGVAFVLDLTDRKRAEAEARESERRYGEMQMEVAHANRAATMGQLTASIAHEVSQPVAAAATNAAAALNWLGARPPNLKEARVTLGHIVKNAHRAGDVIGRIRELINKAPSRNEQVDLNEAIREAIDLTRGETEKNDAAVHTALAEGLPLVKGDRVQLQQVIINLIGNAVEAMSRTSEGTRELLISTRKSGPDVLVAVRDSGPGLGHANLEHLFEAFYTTKAGGLGMGLSICRSIVEAHGGRLWTSANVPRGAVFQFTVPSVPDTAS